MMIAEAVVQTVVEVYEGIPPNHRIAIGLASLLAAGLIATQVFNWKAPRWMEWLLARDWLSWPVSAILIAICVALSAA